MTQYVFVDSRVADLDALRAGLAPDAVLRVLDRGSDGLAQIAAALGGLHGIDAVHIVAHGAPGGLLLGSGWIDAAALERDRAPLGSIGAALSAGGDLLLYGCGSAAGDSGLAFIGRLAQLTGADVAGSTDATGAPALGGNWVLEAATGAIEAQALAPGSGFSGLLDTFLGDAGNNTVTGGAGDDFLFGLEGNNLLQGMGGNDYLSEIGYGGINTLEGGDGADTLDGGSGNDTLSGGNGNDLLDGHAGTNQLNGDAGDDTLNVASGALLTSVLNGGTGDDTLSVATNAAAQVLNGDDGRDTLTGGNGNDTLSGGNGDDDLYGRGGNNVLNGNAGNDLLVTENFTGANTLNGGAGDDNLVGGAGNEVLDGGPGSDYMQGGAGNDTYYVDDLDDYIHDVLGSNDTVYVAVSNYWYDMVDGGLENVIYAPGVTPLPYFVNGLMSGHAWGRTGQPLVATFSFATAPTNETSFQLYSAAEQAAVRLALGRYTAIANVAFTEVADASNVDIRFFRDDLVSAGSGGAAGYAYYPPATEVHISVDYVDADYALGEFAFQVLIHEIGHAMGLKHPHEAPALPAGENTQTNTVMTYNFDVANATQLGMFDVASIQYMYGPNPNARTGNDTYTFADRYLWDGAGVDTLNAAAQTLALTVPLLPGSWIYAGSQNASILAAGQAFIGFGTTIENALGGSASDSITGNTANNLLQGNDGNDSLDGGSGNDTLDGGNGNDSLTGGLGFDSLLGGIGDDILRGGEQADTLDGGEGNDFLGGGKGFDFLYGGNGNDTLAGMVGNDVVDGGTGFDLADYSASADGVTVNLSITGAQTTSAGSGTDLLTGIEGLIGSQFNDTLTGDLNANSLSGGAGADILNGDYGNDTIDGGDGDDYLLGGFNADVITGGIGNDTIGGGNGFDSLSGGEGNDSITGGLGTDTVTGGLGADRFVFRSALDGKLNIDLVTDFTSGTDVIELSASIFTAFAGQIGQNIGLNANLTYDNSNGALAYDADGAGAGAALNFAILGETIHPVLTGSDFSVVV